MIRSMEVKWKKFKKEYLKLKKHVLTKQDSLHNQQIKHLKLIKKMFEFDLFSFVFKYRRYKLSYHLKLFRDVHKNELNSETDSDTIMKDIVFLVHLYKHIIKTYQH